MQRWRTLEARYGTRLRTSLRWIWSQNTSVIIPSGSHEKFVRPLHAHSLLDHRTRLDSHEADTHDDIDVSLDRLRCLASSSRNIPPHVASDSSRDGSSSEAAQRIGTLLVDTQHRHGVNLLHELAVEHGEWTTVTSLVRQLFTGLRSLVSKGDDLSGLVERTDAGFSFEALTDNAVGYSKLVTPTQHLGPQCAGTLDSILAGNQDATINGLDIQQHRALGVVWSAIGTMTIACVRDDSISDGLIRTEVLEILALFHRHGLISPSVYSFTAANRLDAIRQPMTLHLLSSHINAALSDADWRAQDRIALANAEASGRDTSSMTLELRGASLRANIEAVRPELWLELILWSCLHGHWKTAGLEILDVLCKQRGEHAWSAFSWWTSLRQHMPFDGAGIMDWESLKTDLGTNCSIRPHAPGMHHLDTHRTISSEVVSAYVDAFTSRANSAEAVEGVPIADVIARLLALRQLLRQSGVTLQNGSWSSILQRLIDNDLMSSMSLTDAESLVAMSPKIGEEPASSNATDLPSYVFDGNAALLGLLHRALRAQISTESLSGATRIIGLIEACADEARYRSVSDFFRSQQSRSPNHDASSQFTFISNFGGIEYPFFDTQVPMSTIAAYIDLLTKTRSFEKAERALSEDESEGISLPRGMRSDPDISVALARLAAALGNTDLLSKTLKLHRAQESRDSSTTAIGNALLMSHLATGQWRSAVQLMLDLRQTNQSNAVMWDPKCLAIAGRSLLESHPSEESTTTDASMQWSVFEVMTTGINPIDLNRRPKQDRSAELLGILCVLALVDARFIDLLRQFNGTRSFHCPSADSFNVILEGVLRSRGNKIARDLVYSLTGTSEFRRSHRARSPALRTSHSSPRRGSFEIEAADGSTFVVRSPLLPSITTVRLILQHGLRDWKELHAKESFGGHGSDDHLSPSELCHWAEELLSRSETRQSSTTDIRRELANIMRAAEALDTPEEDDRRMA